MKSLTFYKQFGLEVYLTEEGKIFATVAGIASMCDVKIKDIRVKLKEYVPLPHPEELGVKLFSLGAIMGCAKAYRCRLLMMRMAWLAADGAVAILDSYAARKENLILASENVALKDKNGKLEYSIVVLERQVELHKDAIAKIKVASETQGEIVPKKEIHYTSARKVIRLNNLPLAPAIKHNELKKTCRSMNLREKKFDGNTSLFYPNQVWEVVYPNLLLPSKPEMTIRK